MKATIAWFAEHPVAANLLMGFMLVAGLVSLNTVAQKVFPEFTLEIIQVEVRYIGAAPGEIEQSIIQPLEQRLQSIEGVAEMTATAGDGVGYVKLEFKRATDISKALDDVKSEVDRITVFPEEAEEPVVTQISNRTRVVEVALFGDVSEPVLRELVYQVRDELSLLGNISLVEVIRARDYEISIEVPQDTLRAYGLTLVELSAIVRGESLELPAGDIDTAAEDVLVRTLGRNFTQRDFEEIIVRSSAEDGVVRLKDIAGVVDGFTERAESATFNGQPAVFLQVFRIGDERVLDVVDDVKNYLDTELRPSLPPGVDVAIWRNDAKELESRLSLLIKNAVIGLLLVCIALSLFLDLRLALWVALGIGVSFIAALMVMSVLGLSINQLSMFGFILAIGIVVDDAIVTGENIFAKGEAGLQPMKAAVSGAQRVSTPVIFAVATTVAAFVPLLFLPGTIGKFLGDIPAVVIIILSLSLVESLLILPHHLSHIDVGKTPSGRLFQLFDRLRQGADRGLRRFVDGPLERALHFATRHWGVTLLGGFSCLLLTFGVLSAGYVKFSFFPQIEGQYVTASIEMPEGTSLQRSSAVTARVAEIGTAVAAEIAAEFAGGGEIISARYLLVGAEDSTAPPTGGAVSIPGPNQASVLFELIPPEQRDFSSSLLEERWRRALAELHGVAQISVDSNLVSLGFPVQLEVSAQSDVALREAIDAVETGLGSLLGVYDIRNDLDAGKREFKVLLKDEARRYGLTLESLAGQVRAAFFGSEALRVQRGRDEVRVYVRLPQQERRYISDLYDLRIATPDNDFVPLNQVAVIEEGLSPATINRRNGRRIITITANVDDNVITGQIANDYLRAQVLPQVEQRLPGVSFDFGGEQREQAEVGGVLGRNFLLALFAIFTLLAIPFRSYLQPIIVMMAIPFGLVGAVLGHVLLGINLGLLSIFGLVGLTGVVINGALVQIDFANEMRRNGMEPRLSWVEAGKNRFRPIFLTALTTFLGVSPLILEQSVQAQFLIPMAVSIAAGVVMGTGIQMLIVPALGAMLDSFGLNKVEAAGKNAATAATAGANTG